jgi:hypothetical protein
MEVIAVLVASLSLALVSLNKLASRNKHREVSDKACLPASLAEKPEKDRPTAVLCEEELGKAAIKFFEQKKAIKLLGAEKELGMELAEYLTQHEQEIARNYDASRPRG